eukprot:765692-Hanusia_phi.AAC.9
MHSEYCAYLIPFARVCHEKILFRASHTTGRHVSSTSEPTVYLSLDLSPSGVLSLEDALEDFCRIETLDAQNKWECEKCKKRVMLGLCCSECVRAYWQELPKVLIVHFRRFTHNAQGLRKKIHKQLSFPEVLDVGKFVHSLERSSLNRPRNTLYSLYSVISHEGQSLTNGHYISFCKSSAGWLEFDDDSVNKADWDAQVKVCKPYLLFYSSWEKQQDQELPPPAQDLRLLAMRMQQMYVDPGMSAERNGVTEQRERGRSIQADAAAPLIATKDWMTGYSQWLVGRNLADSTLPRAESPSSSSRFKGMEPGCAYQSSEAAQARASAGRKAEQVDSAVASSSHVSATDRSMSGDSVSHSQCVSMQSVMARSNYVQPLPQAHSFPSSHNQGARNLLDGSGTACRQDDVEQERTASAVRHSAVLQPVRSPVTGAAPMSRTSLRSGRLLNNRFDQPGTGNSSFRSGEQDRLNFAQKLERLPAAQREVPQSTRSLQRDL